MIARRVRLGLILPLVMLAGCSNADTGPASPSATPASTPAGAAPAVAEAPRLLPGMPPPLSPTDV
ncbi:hypothetical protein ACFROC_04845, partial [Nocardia tengchongensis]